MKLWLLEPLALSWIITAGQPGMLETPLPLLLPKLFCHQISEEQHAAGFQPAAAAQAACEPPSWGQRGSSAQPKQRQGHRDGAGRTDPPMANTTLAGLRPHPKEVPSWGPPCPNLFSHGCSQECSAAPMEPEILDPRAHHRCRNAIKRVRRPLQLQWDANTYISDSFLKPWE